MNPKRLAMSVCAAVVAVTASALGGLREGGAPEAAFRAPGGAERPETYFFFFGGNISEKGITADLEAVKAAGIEGVKLFNGNSPRGAWPGVATQVKCLSPEWDRLIGHFGAECRRLGLRFEMQVCPGWAMAGGPWIKPEHAMRHLAVSRTDVEGACSSFNLGFKTVRVTLPNPYAKSEPWRDWRDIAVIAFPAPEGDWDKPLAPSSVTGSAGTDWNAWARGRAAAKIRANATTEITYEFAQPVTVRTLELPSVKSLASVTKSFDPGTTVSLKAEDGAMLVEEVALPPSSWQDARPLSLACRETTARRFTLTVKNKHPITLLTVRLLSAAKKDNWEGEACWTLRRLLRRAAPVQSKGAYVKSASVVNLTAQMAKDGTLTWDPPPGRWTVLRIGHICTGAKNIPAPPEGTGLECDKFSTKAADIQFYNYIGRLIAPGGPAEGKLHAMLMDSWECGQQTWTEGLDSVFASRLGYDLFAWIPAVFGYVVGTPGETARFLNDWRTLLSDMTTENFFGHMAKRAHERAIAIDFEAAFGNSIPGDIMKYYKYADTPMCEFWQPAVSFNFTPVKPIVSAAHLYGKCSVGAEAFTSFRVTWDEKLRDLKHNANMNLAEGISHFVFHTFTHNPQEPWLPPGTSFGGRGIGTTFVRGQTWWRHMPAFTDYFARCQAMFEAGNPVADVLWYLGDECDGRPDHYAAFPDGYKYDLCNPDAFLTRISVRDGKWCTPDGTAYGILWIPESTRMLPETMEHLIDGIRKGGVAAMSALPEEPATLKGGERGRERFMQALNTLVAISSQTDCGVFDGHAGRLYLRKTIGDVLKAEKIEPDVQGKGIVWNHRRDEGEDWYFVAPAKEGAGFEGDVVFRDAGGRRAEIWHPESGVIEQASCRLSLAPAQSCFVVFRKSESRMSSVECPAPQAFPLTASWRISFPEGWDVPTNTTVQTLAPWREMFRESPSARAFSGTATYECEFNLEAVTRGERVVLDLGRVESIARVEVNGKTFADLWSYPYSLDVTHAARKGRNALKIEVTDTWYNRLVYEGWLPEAKRRTWTFRRPSERLPLHDSGLIGPVSISVVRKADSSPRPSPVEKERLVGMFYFLWLGEHGCGAPRDISKILAADPDAGKKPDSPVWGRVGHYHHWGEPLYGYYRSDDEWVVRRHMKLIMQAGVDFLFFDTTNSAIYEKNAKLVMRVLKEYHDAGWKVPKVMFYTHSASGKTVRRIYDAIYGPGFAKEVWFRLDGKPVIVAMEEDCSPEMREFFTIVKSQWPNERSKKGGWPWMDFSRPQRVFEGEKVAMSVMNVSVAQHPQLRFGDSAMYGEKGNRGRAFHDGANDPAPGAWTKGYNFQEQWNRAHEAKPDIVLVTGWNEWIAGRWRRQGCPERPVMFVDCANAEYSRDIEMMRGGYGDNYFLQLRENVRRFKGMRDGVSANPPRRAKRYRCFSDGGMPRDHAGYGTNYVNRTQRNVPLWIEVSHDEKSVTFRVKTQKPVVGKEGDGDFMRILVDGKAVNALGETRIDGDEMTLKVPRKALGVAGGGEFGMDFKFVDSTEPCRDPLDWYDHGVVEPLGRLPFTYRGR